MPLKERLRQIVPGPGFLLPWRHGTLIWQFARREVLGRYRGSLLGVGWTLVTPILMLCAYTFVFVGVFRATWPGAEHGGGLEFAVQIFAGLIVFNLFSEVAGRSPGLVTEQANLVKKVVFPLEILPWTLLLSGLFHLALSLAVLVGVTAFLRHGLPLTVVAVPLVLLAFLPVLLGLAWLLSALGVYVRDMGQVMTMVVNLAMFLSPIFYSTAALPEALREWLRWGPLAAIIENLRRVLLQGLWPEWDVLAAYALAGCVIAVFGAAFFKATRRGFADVL